MAYFLQEIPVGATVGDRLGNTELVLQQRPEKIGGPLRWCYALLPEIERELKEFGEMARQRFRDYVDFSGD